MDTNSLWEDGPVRTREGTALRARGVDRVRKILSAAERILLNEGYASFSLRSVAKQAGISLGNLTYYFRSKEDLFQSLIDDVLAEYDRSLQRILSRHRDDPEQKFLAYMRHLLSDCRRTRSQQFFYHFWAISTHDPFVAACRRRAYELFYLQITGLCRQINPDLSGRVLGQRAYLLMALVEGMHVMFGNQRIAPAELDGIAEEFERRVLSIVRAS